MIAIIDYDAGNLKSVEKAFRFLGETPRITREEKELLAADKVVLPGVGSFGDAMEKLHQYGLVEVIREVVEPVCRERGIPLVAGLTCGHSLPTMSLPLGSGVLVQAGADGAVALKFSRIIGEGRAVVEIEIGEERK